MLVEELSEELERLEDLNHGIPRLGRVRVEGEWSAAFAESIRLDGGDLVIEVDNPDGFDPDHECEECHEDHVEFASAEELAAALAVRVRARYEDGEFHDALGAGLGPLREATERELIMWLTFRAGERRQRQEQGRAIRAFLEAWTGRRLAWRRGAWANADEPDVVTTGTGGVL